MFGGLRWSRGLTIQIILVHELIPFLGSPQGDKTIWIFSSLRVSSF